MAEKIHNEDDPCPCGSGHSYLECCGRYHRGDAVAPTAEALMRSRYTAYVLGNEDYLLATWHTSTRPASLDLSTEPATKWLGLKILQTREGMTNDQNGVVEFVARYKINGKAYKLHEVSAFVKQAGQWFYKDRLEG